MNRSLKKKIIGLIIIPLTLCLVGGGLPLITWISNRIHDEQTNRISVLAQSIVLSIKNKMLSGEAKSIQNLNQSFDTIKTIEHIEILKSNGEAAFRDLSTLNSVGVRLGKPPYERPAMPRQEVISQSAPLMKKLWNTMENVSYVDESTGSRIFLVPLLNEKECHQCHGSKDIMRGAVLIRISTEKDQQAIKSIKRQLFAGLMIVLLILAFLLWLSLHKIVVEPILEIARSAKKTTAEGFPSKPLAIDTKDEIGELANNFNQMTSTLKENYQKIKDTESFMTTILESVGEGIVVLDKNDKILMANQFVFKLVNKTREELLGRRCYEVLFGEDSPCPNCPSKKTIRTGLPATKKHQALSENGPTTHMEITSYPIFDQNGEVTQVIEKIAEITDRVEIEDQLRQSEKLAAVGMLASGLAHEVGNPLTSIYSVAQVIERKTKESATKEKIELMKTHIDRITKIVQDFLKFASPSSSNISNFEIKTVIDSAIHISKYDKRVNRLNIKTAYEGQIPFVAGSQDGIHQVFVNLILNAADSVGESPEGSLIITTRRKNDFVLLSFKDNGEGMTESEKNKIFEPFYTTKQPGKGMGLGLFVSYGILKSFGGDISVESEKGKGATFNLELPCTKQKR